MYCNLTKVTKNSLFSEENLDDGGDGGDMTDLSGDLEGMYQTQIKDLSVENISFLQKVLAIVAIFLIKNRVVNRF